MLNQGVIRDLYFTKINVEKSLAGEGEGNGLAPLLEQCEENTNKGRENMAFI